MSDWEALVFAYDPQVAVDPYSFGMKSDERCSTWCGESVLDKDSVKAWALATTEFLSCWYCRRMCPYSWLHDWKVNLQSPWGVHFWIRQSSPCGFRSLACLHAIQVKSSPPSGSFLTLFGTWRRLSPAAPNFFNWIEGPVKTLKVVPEMASALFQILRTYSTWGLLESAKERLAAPPDYHEIRIRMAWFESTPSRWQCRVSFGNLWIVRDPCTTSSFSMLVWTDLSVCVCVCFGGGYATATFRTIKSTTPEPRWLATQSPLHSAMKPTQGSPSKVRFRSPSVTPRVWHGGSRAFVCPGLSNDANWSSSSARHRDDFGTPRMREWKS